MGIALKGLTAAFGGLFAPGELEQTQPPVQSSVNVEGTVHFQRLEESQQNLYRLLFDESSNGQVGIAQKELIAALAKTGADIYADKIKDITAKSFNHFNDCAVQLLAGYDDKNGALSTGFAEGAHDIIAKTGRHVDSVMRLSRWMNIPFSLDREFAPSPEEASPTLA